jgi:hypothetical protein
MQTQGYFRENVIEFLWKWIQRVPEGSLIYDKCVTSVSNVTHKLFSQIFSDAKHR